MDPRAIVDDALEVTVVGSFSRLGYALRRRLHGWASPSDDALAGRTALVTGPTSGLGRATAGALAALGARVLLLGRDETRLARVSAELAGRHGAGRFPWHVVDMGSLASVRSAVGRILEQEDRLDVLVDNAGAIHAQRRTSREGLELTFATMVVGPFVLIGGLLPLLQASPRGRVISVVSGGLYLQPLDLDDLQSAQGDFDGVRAYARAKRASMTLAREWARRLGRDSTVRVDAMHPGWVDTPGLADSLPRFHGLMRPLLRDPAQGIDTIAWLASTTAGRPGGQLFLDRRTRPFDRLPTTRLDAAERRRLWDAVVQLSGEPDPLALPEA
jgi:NAD(P)-dependent dehydrogenase (short-subunit alcohol dehydrogenase family)